MGKTSAAVHNRYAAKVYDRLSLVIPKGRKDDLQVYVDGLPPVVDASGVERKQTVNGLVNDLLRDRIGMTEQEWRHRPTDTDEDS